MELPNRLYVFLNDEIVPMEKASLHVSDLSIQRGYGIFDFFKVLDGHPFFLDEYLDRFYRSASIMRLTVPYEAAKLKSFIYRLIEKNSLSESGVKMILTGGYSSDGYHPAAPNLVITQHPLSLPGGGQVAEGVKIITHPYVRDLAQAKTINYSMGIWLDDKIKEAGAADVLYHRDGMVSEFPRCNFFIVTDDSRVITPADHILHGITRKNVLALAKRKFTAEERPISLDQVAGAKEAFLTSTTKRIVPIVEVDGVPIGDGRPGPVALSLLEDLISLESHDKNVNARPQKFYGF